MVLKQVVASSALFFGFVAYAFSQEGISLTVPAGAPLRLYITKRVSKRLNAPVEAKLLAPVFVFDHEVLPSGTQVIGHVSNLQRVSKGTRISAILGGDFTPLRIAQVEFTSLVLPGGREVPVHTAASVGLNSLFPLHPPKQRNPSAQTTTKQKIKDQMDAQLDRVRSIPDVVRGTDRKEWLSDYLMSRLPYHPQYIRSRTRFDAEVWDPLSFGSEPVTQDSLSLLGSQPAAGSIGHARLLTALDSRTSTQGQKVEAVLDAPLYSADRKLVLPEGTHIDGSVVLAKRAGWFHRAGSLRFNFQHIDLPQTTQLRAPQNAPASAPSQLLAPETEKTLQFRTQGQLSAAESGNAPVKVDREGGVHATESKTRLLGAAVALLVARAAGDNDPIRSSRRGPIIGQSSNVGGRTLGGGLGFGLLGTIAAQSSRNVGAVLGYYGLAWTLYRTLIARGAEVQFDKNAAVDIGFNTRSSPGETKAGSDPATKAK